MRLRGTAEILCRRSEAGWLLRHGRPWAVPRWHAVHHRGRSRECYRNAARLALAQSQLVYCEGYAVAHFPVEHAWCVDVSGQVIEPTWPHLGGEYFGVPIRTVYLRRTLRAQQTWGILGAWGKEAKIYRQKVGVWRQLGL